jgi:hypothetical protein
MRGSHGRDELEGRMRGSFPRTPNQPPPSSDATRHLLPAGEKGYAAPPSPLGEKVPEGRMRGSYGRDEPEGRMRGSFPRTPNQPPPSSDATRHLLPAGEKGYAAPPSPLGEKVPEGRMRGSCGSDEPAGRMRGSCGSDEPKGRMRGRFPRALYQPPPHPACRPPSPRRGEGICRSPFSPRGKGEYAAPPSPPGEKVPEGQMRGSYGRDEPEGRMRGSRCRHELPFPQAGAAP